MLHWGAGLAKTGSRPIFHQSYTSGSSPRRKASHYRLDSDISGDRVLIDTCRMARVTSTQTMTFRGDMERHLVHPLTNRRAIRPRTAIAHAVMGRRILRQEALVFGEG